MHEQGAGAGSSRIENVDIILHQRLVGFIHDLIPGDFGIGQVRYCIQLQEADLDAAAVAVASVDVFGRIVAHRERLPGRTVAAPLVDEDARGLFQVVVFDQYRAGRIDFQKTPVPGLVCRLGQAKAPAANYFERGLAGGSPNQIAGPG